MLGEVLAEENAAQRVPRSDARVSPEDEVEELETDGEDQEEEEVSGGHLDDADLDALDLLAALETHVSPAALCGARKTRNFLSSIVTM